MVTSPLAWPLRLQQDAVLILDETLLPEKVHYLRIKDYHEAKEALVQMKTRAFGQLLTVVYALLLTARQNSHRSGAELLSILKEAAWELESSRPTFPFHEFTSLVLHWAQAACEGGEDIAQALERDSECFFRDIQEKREGRDRAAAAFIKDGDTILTHCNVSGEMVIIGDICRQQRKEISFIVTETRPYLQGARLTAWELKGAGFPVTLIADNAVADVISQGMVDLVIVGSDRSAANGNIANKIGTYQIALVAKQFGIPFYVLTQPSPQIESGREIPIEERDAEELLTYQGTRTAPLGVKGYYPGFDVTPHEYITKSFPLEV
jgi:methylthioribose-1-phosphate isomerase